ncbi:MAG: aldo/keto reductase [Candidatus Latescibacterota bacterium]|nr:aldo/keto reductase [Candidatus Latescibacterota bacterium]
MKRTTLGSTGLEVTQLGLGCAALGGLYGDIPDEQAHDVVRRALDHGLNLFDTAPLYGSGKSEIRVGNMLREVPREEFVLCTKVGRVLDPVSPDDGDRGQDIYDNPPPLKPIFDFSHDGVMRSVEESLNRLGLDHVDVLHIHDPDDHWKDAISGAYPAIAELRSQGVIAGVSAGMNQSEMLARFAREGDFDCFLLAGRYSLLEQGALDELFPLCEQKNIGILAGGTYNSGILAKGAQAGAKYNYSDAPDEIIQEARRLEKIAECHDVNLKAAASQFPLAHPVVTAIIPGTRQPDRVTENFDLLKVEIPGEFWADLRANGLIREEAPTPE